MTETSTQASDQRQEARRIILDLARSIDRRLEVEVREIPGEPRVRVDLSQGSRRGHIEVAVAAVLAVVEDAVARNELRLKIKRAADTMLFRKMPDHRLTVKPVPPPGGLNMSRGGPRGRR
jgi:hypothetical protein